MKGRNASTVSSGLAPDLLGGMRRSTSAPLTATFESVAVTDVRKHVKTKKIGMWSIDGSDAQLCEEEEVVRDRTS